MNTGNSWEEVARRHGAGFSRLDPAPPKPRRIRGALSWLWGTLIQLVFLVTGVALVAWWAHDHTDTPLLVAGLASLGLFVIACDWAHGRGND